jgi:hypothetical protein
VTADVPLGSWGLPVKVGESRGAYEAKFDFTYAVVAICVLFVEDAAVGAVGVPVNAGDARFALVLTAVVTNAVVAIWVVLVPEVAVGAAGVPVKVGLASGALDVSVGWMWSALAKVVEVPIVAVPSTTGVVEDACPNTKAVVANCVVFVPAVAVGAAGVPVNVGEASVASPKEAMVWFFQSPADEEYARMSLSATDAISTLWSSSSSYPFWILS